MTKACYICNRDIKDGELVELTVIAYFHELKSKVAYSIGKPVDAYADTLRHHDCNEDGVN